MTPDYKVISLYDWDESFDNSSIEEMLNNMAKEGYDFINKFESKIPRAMASDGTEYKLVFMKTRWII